MLFLAYSNGTNGRRVMAKRKSAKVVAPSPDGTTLTEREWALKYYYPLPVDFPQEFAAIANLEPVKNWIDKNEIDEFQIRLGQVVYVNRRRYLDSSYQSLVRQGAVAPLPSNSKASSKRKIPTKDLPYFSRIRDCILALRDASTSIDKATKLFNLIDAAHVDLILELAKLRPNNPLANSNIVDVPRRLYQAKHVIDTLAISVQLGTETIIAPKGKGRPGDNHYLPANELMNLWEEITGKRVVTPRAPAKPKKGPIAYAGANERKKGKSRKIQDSTEFVQIGLSMVDSTITPAEARTAIRSALQTRKEFADADHKKLLKSLKLSAD